MADEHENDTRPAEEPPVGHPGGAAPPRTEYLDTEPPRGGRFRRWARSSPAQFVAVGLLAGLVGGLAGGGIVAAVDGRGGRAQLIRVRDGGPPFPGFRQFRVPGRAPFFTPRPVPSPTTTS